MIKYICDLCHKEAEKLNTVILHKKQFQYCGKCSKRAYVIKQVFRKEMHEEYILYEERLKQKEEYILKEMIGRN